MEPKSIFKSKTIIFNLLTVLAISLTAVADHSLVLENPTAVGAVAVLSAIVNLGLRLVTKQPVK